MTLDEARELVNGPIWPAVRDGFAKSGELKVYAKGDERRLEYLDAATRAKIELWMKAIPQVAEWRMVVDGAKVRELKRDYPGVYPEVLRFAPYFQGKKEVLPLLLKLKFPEAYKLCYC